MNRRVKRTWIVENTWKCEYCDGSVRNLYGECKVCGGPLTEADLDHIENSMRELGLIDLPDRKEVMAKLPELEEVILEKIKRGQYEIVVEKSPTSTSGDNGNGPVWRDRFASINWRPILIGGAIVLAVASLVGLLSWFFIP